MDRDRDTEPKPLFDSEDFAFIGSNEGNLYVYCRKCDIGTSANIELVDSSLHATCPNCGNRADFKIASAVMRKLSRSGAGR